MQCPLPFPTNGGVRLSNPGQPGQESDVDGHLANYLIGQKEASPHHHHLRSRSARFYDTFLLHDTFFINHFSCFIIIAPGVSGVWACHLSLSEAFWFLGVFFLVY